jgi:tripartite-type tricarboxylate transporter receptor subunit TctC
MRFAAQMLSIALLAAPALVVAQGTFPTKPVKVVLPLPAGGIVDIVGRAVTEKIASSWGQPIIIENRPGANSNIGIEAVAKSVPDGHTWLIGGPAILSNPAIYPSLPWHPLKDFACVGLIVWTQNIVVVPAALPVSTLKEFVAYAKARPGQLNFVNPGSGSSNHMQTELLRQVAGLDMVGIGYKGQPPAIPDLINGQVSFMAPSVGLVQAHIQSGRLKPLATFTSERLPQLPQVPTIAEAGYPEALLVPWFGAFVSSKTPKDILDRVHGAIAAALQSPEVIDRLQKSGSQPGKPFTLAQLDAIVREDMERYAKVAKFANIRPE